MTRSQKAITNTVCELLLELVTAVCGFILPRLILSHFGSAYNGITNSISQFIGCIALMKSGIGSVTRAALYKPLNEKNTRGISEVVNAAERFMRKIALVFIVLAFVLAALYPLLVSEDFDWFFVFSLVLILSVSTFVQYFFGLTYQMVLMADQKNYMISLANTVTTILNTVIASILIISGFEIRVVKSASALVFILAPVFYNVYVRKAYKIDKSAAPQSDVIAQRWDAFGHQLANFINTNTDIVVITFFAGVKEVSVYTVYSMAGNAVKKAVTAIGSGTTAAFGNMLAKKETETLKKRFSQYELLIFYVSTILLITAAILITPFTVIYTRGIEDVDYNRPLFGFLVCLSVYIMCVKLPYEQLVYASGEFRNTKNGAYAEAGINIFLSCILVAFLGIDGAIIGTIAAITYRTVRYHIFICNHIIDRPKTVILSEFFYSTVCAAVCMPLSMLIPDEKITSYTRWIFTAIPVTAAVFCICTAAAFVFFGNTMRQVYMLLFGIVKKLLKKGSR